MRVHLQTSRFAKLERWGGEMGWEQAGEGRGRMGGGGGDEKGIRAAYSMVLFRTILT